MSQQTEEVPYLEYRTVGEVQTAGQVATDVAQVAIALSAAFVVYRALMSERLRQMRAPDPGEETRGLIEKIWDALENPWIEMLVPAVMAGYALVHSDIDPLAAEESARAYAKDLADQLNKTSNQAFTEGYTAGLNKG